MRRCVRTADKELPMPRIAHYVSSTHWDREWYEPFQGFRMRLVSMLDEVFDTFDCDPEFKKFYMDGQVIPILDYLEIRPENRERIGKYLTNGRLRIGPWYVLPDEWLVCGESLVRNLQYGMEVAKQLGAEPSRTGFACDMFGHVGQMPQIFDQLGIPVAFVWRGTYEKEHHGHFNWAAPDGTTVPAYRFGRRGYCSYAFEVRRVNIFESFVLDDAVDRLVDFVKLQARRVRIGPLLLFDGGDHLEIQRESSELIRRANESLSDRGITIVHSDLDSYAEAVLRERLMIERTVSGELRETGRDPGSIDEQWLIPGVYSSRIHLKQQNAACEDELLLWAEPFSAFASAIGEEYPEGYLRTAWKHLLENHPHDSICGCSPDEVHDDMMYRFHQSIGISSRVTGKALTGLARAASPEGLTENTLFMAVFNPTAEDLDEPVDIEIPLPSDWPHKYKEFFGFEDKYGFRLYDADGEEIPYQLIAQVPNSMRFRRIRYKFPKEDPCHLVTVTVRLVIPSYGYTTFTVVPEEGPTRHLGSMAVSHRAIENEYFHVEAAGNGTITLTDKRTGRKFTDLLTFEDRADIGDGWYHGLAVNDRIHVSTASAAEISLAADGINRATLRIAVTMKVPKHFDFRNMTRSEHAAPLVITSDVTLRRGAARVEVKTTVQNTIEDHRLRVLFPTGYNAEAYLSDSAFDAVERRVALAPDNNIRRELDVETRPQVFWTAYGDGRTGLAVVTRGLPESAVVDTPGRPVALTLLRSFRKAVLTDDNPGGQIQGDHTFTYAIVPYGRDIPLLQLFHLGQRMHAPVKSVCLRDYQRDRQAPAGLPRVKSFMKVEGHCVVTSVRMYDGVLQVRLFNPYNGTEKIAIEPSAEPVRAEVVTLDGRSDERASILSTGRIIEMLVPAKHITTVAIHC